MKIVTDGLVIREMTVKESDKIITVLTRDNGVLTAYAPGAKNIKNSKSTACSLLTYSQFVFYMGRDRYTVDEAHAKEVFMLLRSDLEKLALAQYFCELASVSVPEGEHSEEHLRLTLNALHYLCTGKKPRNLIKAVFELRMMSLCGYMPNLVFCSECGIYEHEQMGFYPDEGTLICGDCAASAKKKPIITGIGVTTAMRHCIYADFKKLFAFTLSDRSLPILSNAAESYTTAHFEKKLGTLEFYNELCGKL